MTLKKYHKKRDFKKTPEPKGHGKHSSLRKKKLFIIQKHAASHLHYDFRLELNGVLLSWAVPKGPALDPNIKRLAMHVEDHPLEYGSFEGIIPKGQYGGGTVMLWDKGEWISEEDNPTQSYRNGNLSFILKAKKLNGRFKLIRMHHDDKTWLLIKVKDAFSQSIKNYDITIKQPNSVISNLSLEEIENHFQQDGKNLTSRPFPKKIAPELATLVDNPPRGKAWLHEIKWDGYRLLAIKKNNRTHLLTRNNNDWTKKIPNIPPLINKIKIKNLILDGEIVILDEKQHANFQLLQNAIKKNIDKKFIYYIFDLLYLDKYDLRNLPLIERKKMLKDILTDDQDILRYSDHIIGSGKKIFTNACKLGLEGIISKHSQSPYIESRTKDWLKVKCIKQQEFIIAGFTPPQKSRNYFGALLLGTYNKNKELIYNGRVGTGFTQSSLKMIYKRLIKEKCKIMPFKKCPPASSKVTWVKPILIAEIKFKEWTKDSYLRHPSFKGLRDDKSPNVIIQERPTSLNKILTAKNKKPNSVSLSIRLTNPNKILYPEDKITKKALAEYYNGISEWILPYIVNRPLTIVRCPESYKDCFYQKHIKKMPPQLHGIMIKEKENNSEYLYIKDGPGLLALTQMGCLEIHPWGSTIKKIEYPDMIIFDLDPGVGVAWKKIVNMAFDIKKQLEDFKLKCFVKTTGGKGLHVVMPIKPEYDWQKIKNFAHAFADFMVINHPTHYVNKMQKTERKGKIYLDYLRNQRGATVIAPYSTRARKHAPIATPIHWDELTHDHRDIFFTIKNLPMRLSTLKKDPWGNFNQLQQSLQLEKYQKDFPPR